MKTRCTVIPLFTFASVLLLGPGCQIRPHAVGESALPRVILRAAPRAQMRGANSASLDKRGETDCNSPAHWDGDVLYLLNSAGHPWRSAGPDLFHLTSIVPASHRP